MKTVIVYESMFGNTEHIARKVADGLRRAWRPDGADGCSTMSRRDDLTDCDLLVVGAPTHAFSLSRPSTRDDAVRQGADPRARSGRRSRVAEHSRDGVPRRPGRPQVAVFDTRVEKVRRLPGSAAKRAARVVRAQGFEMLDRPTSFYVADLKGPATLGELDRAVDWGTRLFQLVQGRNGRDAT